MSQVLGQTKETTANAGINLSPTVVKTLRRLRNFNRRRRFKQLLISDFLPALKWCGNLLAYINLSFHKLQHRARNQRRHGTVKNQS